MSNYKTTLITDLDNTLFDWVELWLNSFSAMLDEIVHVSGVKKELLIPEIAAVHQRHGTSEYSMLIEELPALKRILNGRPATEVFASAVQAYRDQRRKYLVLYPSVAATLAELKSRGTRIIGYTESMAFYSNYRVKRLELDGVFDFIFCPADHVLPEGVSADDLRYYPAEHYSLQKTIQHFTPKGSKKPDARVLEAIVNDLGLTKSECVYVGDSLMKDIAMAADCGIENAWAKYGQAHSRPEYRLLQDVTHWTPEEVAREQRIRARVDVHPDHTLEVGFSELLDIFDFQKF